MPMMPEQHRFSRRARERACYLLLVATSLGAGALTSYFTRDKPTPPPNPWLFIDTSAEQRLVGFQKPDGIDASVSCDIKPGGTPDRNYVPTRRTYWNFRHITSDKPASWWLKNNSDNTIHFSIAPHIRIDNITVEINDGKISVSGVEDVLDNGGVGNARFERNEQLDKNYAFSDGFGLGNFAVARTIEDNYIAAFWCNTTLAQEIYTRASSPAG